MSDADENKTIVINGSLLHTLLLIAILMFVFGSFCMQIIFNFMESRDRDNIQDLQVIGMVAGSIANTEQLMQTKEDVKSILDKRKAGKQPISK
jgi:hypothetical protein